jgi:general secretion pathway protein H
MVRTHAGLADQQGFSLLEMLVVLVIVGIVTAAAGIAAVSGSATRDLRGDAVRLGQLFALAQSHARSWGTPVVWHHDARRYWFEPVVSPRPALSSALRLDAPSDPDTRVFDSGALRPRPWGSQSLVKVSVTPAGDVVFTDDWLSGPHRVELTDGRATFSIDRSSMGVYRVHP